MPAKSRFTARVWSSRFRRSASTWSNSKPRSAVCATSCASSNSKPKRRSCRATSANHEPGQTTFDPLELDRFSQLQQLSRALGESVSDLVSIQGLLDDLTRNPKRCCCSSRASAPICRKASCARAWCRSIRWCRTCAARCAKAAQSSAKRAQLRVDGAQGEMDRNLLERMKAPFEHMLRNALAHGIESPEERVGAGKSSEGTVNIAVSARRPKSCCASPTTAAAWIREAIRKKAIERGLLKPDVELSDRDLYGFVLETGFSTAEQVTQLAGRGVGMDVVHNEIKQLGGSLLIDSNKGHGATFTIRLPFTLAVTQAILVKLGESTYAIPMSSVQGVVRIARDDLDRRLATGNPKYSYAGEEFNIYELSQLLGVPARPRDRRDAAAAPDDAHRRPARRRFASTRHRLARNRRQVGGSARSVRCPASSAPRSWATVRSS
jgi:chemosensory pili system protein ChpA (sensor histidine kinase/response regulator)